VDRSSRPVPPTPNLRAAALCAAVATFGWMNFLRHEEGGLYFALFTLALVGLGAAIGRRWALAAALGVTVLGLAIAAALPDSLVDGPSINAGRAVFFIAFPVLVPTAAGMALRRVFGTPPSPPAPAG
jgi:hypothetical protein